MISALYMYRKFPMMLLLKLKEKDGTMWFSSVMPWPAIYTFTAGRILSDGHDRGRPLSRENRSGRKVVRADHFWLPKLVRPRTTFGCQKWSGLPKVVRVYQLAGNHSWPSEVCVGPISYDMVKVLKETHATASTRHIYQ